MTKIPINTRRQLNHIFPANKATVHYVNEHTKSLLSSPHTFSMIALKASSSSHFTSPYSLHLTQNINPRNLCFFSPNTSFGNNKCRVLSRRISTGSGSNRSKYRRRDDELVDEYEDKQRKAHCEVDVISWRERRIKATVVVYSDVESVWNALTDYERLADFIPNLISSERIPCPHSNRIWLEQRGLQRAMYWHIEARVVLDLQEFINSADSRELHFSMVDGDFKKFEGKWLVEPGTRSSTTTLSYEVNVIPRFNFPAIFLERIIRSDLPVNLQALACRAERNSEAYRRLLIGGSTSVPTSRPAVNSPLQLVGAFSNDKVLSGDLKENLASSNVAPSPLSSPAELNSNWGVFGKVCRLDKPCMVDEVHFRRFDNLLENGGVHRGVVASITVKAPVREVWNVLTAYENLPEIVPNLAISRILSRENNKVRIIQEGCKGLLYMVLHACVVLDLCEKLEEEISFEQVEGDFDSFQGKWLFEQLGNHHTLLKYSVESKMHKDTFLSEAIVEEVIYEDLPSNLSAIRDFVEKREAEKSRQKDDDARYLEGNVTESSYELEPEYRNPFEQVSDFNGPISLRQRPRVPGLQRDIEVLKAELLTFISQFGQEGFMPMRKQLREHGRVDIEKAITRMGGFRKIALLMNLSLAYKHRKPKGYWDDLENLEEEITRFQRSWGMDPSYMPSRKTFERAGRYDIARALEKWGGLHEVSRLLSLKVRHPSRQANPSKEKAIDSIATNDTESEEKTPDKAYVSQDTQKWLTKLKHLDINWME